MKKIVVLGVFSLLLIVLLLGFVSAFGASVHVPEKYTQVSAGERFYFTLDIKYPENIERNKPQDRNNRAGDNAQRRHRRYGRQGSKNERRNDIGYRY